VVERARDHLEAWAGDEATVDGVAHVHVAVHRAFCFKVPQGCETGFQILLGVHHRLDGAILPRLFEKLLFIAPVGFAGQEQVCVRINQARYHRGVAEVENRGSGGDLDSIRRTDIGDATALDHNHLVV